MTETLLPARAKHRSHAGLNAHSRTLCQTQPSMTRHWLTRSPEPINRTLSSTIYRLYLIISSSREPHRRYAVFSGHAFLMAWMARLWTRPSTMSCCSANEPFAYLVFNTHILHVVLITESHIVMFSSFVVWPSRTCNRTAGQATGGRSRYRAARRCLAASIFTASSIFTHIFPVFVSPRATSWELAFLCSGRSVCDTCVSHGWPDCG
jgi:hypothetical protein